MVRYMDLGRDKENRRLGVVPIARKVYEAVSIAKKEQETVTMSSEVASIQVENNKFGGFQIELSFHENNMDDWFEFYGSSPPLHEFTDEVAKLAKILEETLDLNEFEFAELEAASIGRDGRLTDYEFVYETGTASNPPSKDEFNRLLDGVTADMPQSEMGMNAMG